MRTKLACAFCICLGAITSCPAVADVADANAAHVMWVAFECSTYAERAGKAEEAGRLFRVGFEAGKQFMAAARSGSISEQEAKENVPWIVTLMLSGPSDDFVIGRIYESAMNQAFDSIVKEDAQGMPLDIKDWVNDPELEASIARNKYQQSNCALL